MLNKFIKAHTELKEVENNKTATTKTTTRSLTDIMSG